MHRTAALAAALFLLVLAACASPTATPTPEPTRTPRPTATEAPPTATPEPEVATRENPIPLGKALTLSPPDGGEVNLSVVEVVKGDDAMATLKAENRYNDPPAAGNQYVLAKLRAVVDGDVPDAFKSWDPSPWALVANGRAVDGSRTNGGVVMPKPEFIGDIIPPGELEGWAIFEAPADADLALVFVRTGDRGGWWFALE